MVMDASPKLVRDLMSVGVPTCALEDSVVELTRWFLEKDVEGVIVLDEHGHGAGAITRDELVKSYARDDYAELTAQDAMRPDVPELPPDIPLAAAAQLMRDMGVRVIFLNHHAGGIKYPAAYLTYTHLLRHLAARDGEDLKDLGIKAEREAPLETFYRRRDEALRKVKKARGGS
jgi:CBS domain-containing protein